MLRYLCIFIGIILFSVNTFANFHGGLSIGGSSVNFYQRAVVSRPGTFYVLDKENINGDGAHLGVFAGYNNTYKKFNSFLEFGVVFNRVRGDLSNKEFISSTFTRTSYKISKQFNFSLLPGYSIKPDLTLGPSLSYSYSLFQISTNDSSLVNKSHYLHGLTYGAFVTNQLMSSMNLRVKYEYFKLNKVVFSTLDQSTSTFKKTNISPRKNQLSLDLIYLF